MKHLRFLCILLPLLLTGCGSDSIADRIYAQALGISGQHDLILTLQSSEDEICRTVRAGSLPEAFALEEAQAGGRVFIGHTELICLDRNADPSLLRELFYENGISPGCKLLYAPPEYLQSHDSTPAVHTLRLAERDGMLPETGLATAMEEWLGSYKTALLPVPGGTVPGLVLLHEDGTAARLSDSAARGMLWMRDPPRKTEVSLDNRQIRVQQVCLRRTWQEEAPVYTLTLRAPEVDAATRKSLQKRIADDCRAAADAAASANADVIGLETLLESEGISCPEQLPSVTVYVTVGE